MSTFIFLQSPLFEKDFLGIFHILAIAIFLFFKKKQCSVECIGFLPHLEQKYFCLDFSKFFL
jgi:hypothetical protein